MKKFLQIVFVATILFAGINNAQTLFVEEFNYPAGTLLTNQGWIFSSGTINPLQVSAPGLTYTGYPSNAGNAVTLTTTGEDDYKSFTPVSSGSIYVSFLINVQGAEAGGDYFFAVSASTSQTNYYLRTHIKSSGNGYLIGLSKNNELSGGYIYGTTVRSFNTTYLVVLKHTFSTANDTDDAQRVFAFSGAIPTTEPATSEIGPYVQTGKTDPADLGIVTIRQGTNGSAPALRIDGIRVATSWSALLVATSVNEAGALPSTFELAQNYPNPFNPSTVIKYQVPQNTHVNLSVYDILGNKVATLENREKAAGSYEVEFDAANIPSGVYFYTIQTGSFTQTKKMILMK